MSAANTHAFQGALFDWDGVIIDSHEQHEEAWVRLAAELGEALPPGFFKDTFGMLNRNIIGDYLGWGDGDIPEIDRLGVRKEELYREVIREVGIEPLPGVVRLLAGLHDAGVRCAVGSSTPRINLDTIMDMIGIKETFDEIVSADDVTRGKPDPQVFLLGAERIGAPADGCVVFEDAHVGIEAGLAGGMKVVAVATTHPPESLTRAHLVVESLEEVDVEKLRGLFE